MQKFCSGMRAQNVCCQNRALIPYDKNIYICSSCQIKHQCGEQCNAKVNTEEGVVCSLTGQFLETVFTHSQPFTKNGRSQSHFVVRPVTKKKRSGSIVDPCDIKAQKLVHSAIEDILKNQKRKTLQQAAKARFIKDSVKVAKKSTKNFLKISKGIKLVTDQYIMSLLPHVDSDQVIGKLSKNPTNTLSTKVSNLSKANRFTHSWSEQT